MKWLEVADLLIIHARVSEATGGVLGVVNPGALESALARPFTTFGGSPLYRDLIDKVAALIHSLIAFHPFADGNKRVALVAPDVCLRLNGLRLTPSNELGPFFWSIARAEQTPETIAAWLRTHSEPWTDPAGT